MKQRSILLQDFNRSFSACRLSSPTHIIPVADEGSFDPKTEKFQTWPIPSGGGVVRNMMSTYDGNLALACSGVNKVALVKIERSGNETAQKK